MQTLVQPFQLGWITVEKVHLPKQPKTVFSHTRTPKTQPTNPETVGHIRTRAQLEAVVKARPEKNSGLNGQRDSNP